MRFFEDVIIADPAAKISFEGYDNDTYIQETADDTWELFCGGNERLTVKNVGGITIYTGLYPSTNHSFPIGANGQFFSDVFTDELYIADTATSLTLVAGDLTFTDTNSGAVSLASLVGGASPWSVAANVITPAVSGDDVRLAATEQLQFIDTTKYIVGPAGYLDIYNVGQVFRFAQLTGTHITYCDILAGGTGIDLGDTGGNPFNSVASDRYYVAEGAVYIDITGSGGTLDMTFTSTLAGTVDLADIGTGSSNLAWSGSTADAVGTYGGSNTIIAEGSLTYTSTTGLFISAADTVIGQLRIEGGKATVTALDEIAAQVLFNSNDSSVTSDTAGKIAVLSEATNGANWGMGFYTYQQTGDLLTEKMRIDYRGYVGIGDTGPSYKLDITATGNTVGLQIKSSSDAGAGGILRLRNTDTAVTTGSEAGIIEFYKDDGSTEAAGIVGKISSKSIDAGGTYNMIFETGQDVETPAGINAKLTWTYTGLLNLSAGTTTGAPALQFYQTTTRRAYISYLDSGDTLRLAAEYGDMQFYTGTSGTEVLRMHIHQDGDISINASTAVTATYRVEIFGTDNKGRAADWTATSDMRLKTNIKSYGSVLDGLVQLYNAPRGLSVYNRWVMDEDNKPTDHCYEERELGFIAQEMLEIFPVIVNGSKEEYYDISYMRLAAIAATGVAELKDEKDREIDELKSRIGILEIDNEQLKRKIYGNDND